MRGGEHSEHPTRAGGARSLAGLSHCASPHARCL